MADIADSGTTDREPVFAETHLSARDGFLIWSGVILASLGLPFFAFIVGKVFNGWWTACPAITPCSPISTGVNWLAIISCSCLFGALGVMSSLILRRRIDPGLSKLSVLKALLLVYGLGAIFSIMLLALFIGGFLQGNLFPSFQNTISWMELNFRIPDWGKIVVWSFIVGFSERLMPGVFDQLTERLAHAQGPKE